MSRYKKFSINLKNNQKNKIKDAIIKDEWTTLKFKKNELDKGNDILYLTTFQINKIKKKISKALGVTLDLSRTQLKRNSDNILDNFTGGGISSDLKNVTKKEIVRQVRDVDTLDNQQIEFFMKDVPYFIGVFANDKLPSKIPPNASGITNLEDSNLAGSHWTAFYNATDRKHVLYFDSFGVRPTKEVQNFLKTSGKKIRYNENDIQSLHSDSCGYYSQLFVVWMTAGRSYDDFLNHFDKTATARNQKIIDDFKQKEINN